MRQLCWLQNAEGLPGKSKFFTSFASEQLLQEWIGPCLLFFISIFYFLLKSVLRGSRPRLVGDKSQVSTHSQISVDPIPEVIQWTQGHLVTQCPETKWFWNPHSRQPSSPDLCQDSWTLVLTRLSTFMQILIGRKYDRDTLKVQERAVPVWKKNIISVYRL